MRQAVLTLALLAPLACAHAGAAVGVQCDRRSDKVVVRYYDDVPSAAPAPSEQRWNLFDLLVISADEKEWADQKQVRTTCNLKAARFEVTIDPYPGGANPFGTCGAVYGAFVTIRHNGVLVLSKYVVDEYMCSSEPNQYTSEISIAAGDHKATFFHTNR